METEEQARGDYHRKGWSEGRPAPLTGGTTTSRPVPEVVLLLDGAQRIVRWTGPHPGPRLGELAFHAGTTIHDALHPNCSRTHCRLAASFAEAWATHRSGLPVEWLFSSVTLDGVLKLRLQPVAYACGALFGDAVACYGDHSVLFLNDITVGYRAAEHDENPRWSAVREPVDAAPLIQRFLPAGSPVLEPAPAPQPTSLTAQLLVAQEVEQKRLAAELHDGLGQSLSLLRFELEGCTQQRQSDPAGALQTLARALDYVQRSQEELRRITSNLKPVGLNKYGLTGALDLLCRELHTARPEMQVQSAIDGMEQKVPEELAIAVYRIAQEAINNVVRHAAAQSLRLEFRTPGEAVELTVADDGMGLPLNIDSDGGFGLTTMRERTESLGGLFTVVSAPGAGCEIKARWDTAALRLLR